MSFIAKLMIGGWATTLGMIAVCALNESGKLSVMRKRIASWVQPSDATNLRMRQSEHASTAQAD